MAARIAASMMVISKEYERWIAELALRFRSSQIKAAAKVNDEMLRFYWSVGEDIEKRHFDNRYGSHFYENVSKDLRKALGITRGLSSTTIKYTHKYYLLYNQLVENRQQVVDDFTTASLQHPDSILQIIFRIYCGMGRAPRLCPCGRHHWRQSN